MLRNQRKAMIALLPQTHRHSFVLFLFWWFVILFRTIGIICATSWFSIVSFSSLFGTHCNGEDAE